MEKQLIGSKNITDNQYLKKVLDPNDILAPGNYDFRQY